MKQTSLAEIERKNGFTEPDELAVLPKLKDISWRVACARFDERWGKVFLMRKGDYVYVADSNGNERCCCDDLNTELANIYEEEYSATLNDARTNFIMTGEYF